MGEISAEFSKVVSKKSYLKEIVDLIEKLETLIGDVDNNSWESTGKGRIKVAIDSLILKIQPIKTYYDNIGKLKDYFSTLEENQEKLEDNRYLLRKYERKMDECENETLKANYQLLIYSCESKIEKAENKISEAESNINFICK